MFSSLEPPFHQRLQLVDQDSIRACPARSCFQMAQATMPALLAAVLIHPRGQGALVSQPFFPSSLIFAIF